tara:strand:- start:1768 stop:2076 length:309 start_codon:yes stop_codon:yes gene_type:complete
MSQKNGSDDDVVILPNNDIWNKVVKISIEDDKPIMMDYWLDSLEKQVIIGVRENGEKLLVKSQEEFTSPIQKIFRISEVYIICTENSIYITRSDISNKRITG